MRDVTVAVSGLSVAGMLAPGLPVVSALRAEPQFAGRIVGFSYDPLEAPNYLPHLLDHCFLLPYLTGGAEQLFNRIKRAHSRCRLDAIIPTLDAELPVYIKLLPRLSELGIGLILPELETLDRRAKINLSEMGELLGVKTPRSVAAYSFEGAAEAARQLRLPFMVKGHLHGATLIYSLDQLAAAAQAQTSKLGFPVVLQEYVNGVEYDVAALGSREGHLLGAVPMKKLQIDPQGKAWGAITVDDAQLLRLAQEVVEGLGWPGPLELELIRRQETGEFYLVEVNPRFPSWIHLAVAAGQNLPWASVRLALGEEVEPFAGYEVGLMSLRISMDVTCPLAVYESLVTTGEIDHRNLRPDLIQPQWRSWEADAALSRQIAERRHRPPQRSSAEQKKAGRVSNRLFEERTR